MVFPYYVIFEAEECAEGKDCLLTDEAFSLMDEMT